MRVLFMGTPDFAVPALRAIAAGPDEVVGVVTQPDRPSGRKRRLTPPAVKVAALELGLPVLQPDKLTSDEAFEALVALEPDICVVAAYGKILRQRVLDIPRHGCINIHASLLPRWRGAAPINWAISAGDRETGICIMQMERGLDTGPVLARWDTPIEPLETAGELFERLASAGARLLVEVLTAFREGAAPVPTAQDDELATYARMLTKADARIDFTWPARQLAAHIRGMTPWPGASCDTPDGVLKLCRARAIDGASGGAEPGTVLTANRADGLRVAAGDGVVEVLELQRPGKRVLTAAEFLAGARETLVGQRWTSGQ